MLISLIFSQMYIISQKNKAAKFFAALFLFFSVYYHAYVSGGAEVASMPGSTVLAMLRCGKQIISPGFAAPG